MANLVEPLSTAPQPAPVEATAPQPAPAPEGGGADISPELVQIPVIQGLLAGEPAAVSVPIAEFDAMPEGKLITQNKDSLMNAGIGFYRSLGGDLGAMFNRMFVSDSEIQAADKAGKLLELAPPFSQVNQALSQAGAQNPVLRDPAGRPTGFKTGGAPAPAPGPVANTQQAPAPMPSGKPSKTPARVVQSKMRALNPQSPTEGAKPGAGRLLNSILKPVV